MLYYLCSQFTDMNPIKLTAKPFVIEAMRFDGSIESAVALRGFVQHLVSEFNIYHSMSRYFCKIDVRGTDPSDLGIKLYLNSDTHICAGRINEGDYVVFVDPNSVLFAVNVPLAIVSEKDLKRYCLP